MKIVVIGGTGLIGSKAVAMMEERGHKAIAAAPSTGVDTITGNGLADALGGADIVIDVPNAPSRDDQAALQFFELIPTIADLSTDGGEVRLPAVAFQPIAARDVAAFLVDAALAEPVNGTIEIAGPARSTLDAAVRTVLAYRHDARSVVADRDATYLGVAVEGDMLVPAGSARLGRTTLDQWLAETPPRA